MQKVLVFIRDHYLSSSSTFSFIVAGHVLLAQPTLSLTLILKSEIQSFIPIQLSGLLVVLID
jgi:hypothetical protein